MKKSTKNKESDPKKIIVFEKEKKRRNFELAKKTTIRFH